MNYTIEHFNENGIVDLLKNEEPNWLGSFHIHNPALLDYLSQSEIDTLLSDKSEETKAEWMANWVRDSGQATQ